MSSAVKSTRGSKSDALSLLSVANDGSRNTHREPEILWPEWADADINSEKWGAALKFDPGAKGKPASPLPLKETKGKNSSRIDNLAAKESDQYEDPYPVELPWSIHRGHPVYWQRPHLVFRDMKLLIRSENAPTCPDLVTSNRRLLRSEFIRSFVSSIQILTYIGNQYPFEIEWQTLQFSANTRNLPWEPWHHIYSIGRAGGTAQHSPVCNTLGKYVVRLFWLGCWRKILVDDRLPVTSTGRLLLPTTTFESNNEIELWPLLLTKALMKIASLSWTDLKELVDFDIISCLTGWAVQKLNIKGLDIMDKWEICCSYSNHFTWDKKLLRDETSQVLENETILKDKGKDLKDANKKKPNIEGTAEDTVDFHLVGTLADLRNYSDILDDITPCWSHECLIESTRSIPLVKQISDVTDDFASWKEFRWINWAIEQGIWEADFTLDNKKFVKIVSSLRKVSENNTADLETTYKEKCIKHSVEEFKNFFEQREAAKAGKKPATAAAQAKDKSAASKTPKTVKVERFIDPSIWCYFNKVGDYIHSLSIYIKPSSFNSRYVLTNFKISGPPVSKKAPKKEDKKSKDADSDGYKHILWENVLQISRNDTMYLFTDSIDFRLTVFTLAHIGKDFPEGQKHSSLSSEMLPIGCTKPLCVSGNCIDDCSCQKKDSKDSMNTNFIDKRRTASIIVEDFDWTSRQTGDMSMFLKTYGTSSLFFNFAKGRHVKRIWMNADPAFCLHIFSDDPHLKIGKCDEILERMAVESELLTKKSFDICAGFGNLVRHFATPEYPQALRSFYKSYLPNDIQLSKNDAARIHSCFLNELKNILADSYPETFHYDMSRAIRVLFLDPNFRIPYVAEFEPYSPEPTVPNLNDTCPCRNTRESDNEKEKEMAAVKLQSIFKMYHIKRMKDIHNINHNSLPRIIECIKNIYMDIFSSKSKDLHSIKLVRGMIFNPDISDLVEHYMFYRDLKSVIDLKLFSGDITEVKQIKFMPLMKRSFVCLDDEVYMRPYIFSSLPTYFVQVFDNDTGEEIDRYTNNALVHKYIRNKTGYTLFAYGLSSLGIVTKTHNWKLLIASEKMLVASSIEIDPQPNSLSQLEGVYLPNLDNLVTKIRVKLSQNCRGTFHLQSSSPSVRLKMECVTSGGNIVAEAYGMSTVMIPFVNLIIEPEDPIAQDLSLDKSMKHVKKVKSQRRVSSKLLSIKDRRKLDKESTMSISHSIFKKKTLSNAERPFEFKDFFIRIIVLENSWPLTIAEWNLVNAVRAQSNVEPELFAVKSPKKGSGNASRKQTLRNTPRRASRIKEISISKPFWIFSTYCDGPQKQLTISIDFSRFEEIREIKKKIISDDTARYLEGKEKRQEFLERSYLQWTPPSPSVESVSDHSLLPTVERTSKEIVDKHLEISLNQEVPTFDESVQSTKSVCRTCQKEIDPNTFQYLKAPESRHKMLPPFDYNKYYEKINEYRWPVDEKRENEILDAVSNEIEKFEEENVKSIEVLDKFLEETKKNYKKLNNWYKEIREESNELWIKNEVKREYYREKLKDEKPEQSGKKKK